MGLGPGPGSLVARWCSGLARVDDDPANDGLWTPKTRKRPIDGSSNLPRATRIPSRIYHTENWTCEPVGPDKTRLEWLVRRYYSWSVVLQGDATTATLRGEEQVLLATLRAFVCRWSPMLPAFNGRSWPQQG